MPRMSKRDKEEWNYFLNDRGRITYNELLTSCAVNVTATVSKASEQ